MKLVVKVKKKLKKYKAISELYAKLRTYIYIISFIIEKLICKIYIKFINKNDNEKLEKVLLIKPDGIGDFIIFSNYLEAYIDLYKDYKVDLLVDVNNYELAKDCKKLNNIITVDRLKDKYCLLKIVKYVINQNYNKIILPIKSRSEFVDKICILSNAKEVITFSGDTCNMNDNIRIFNNKYYSKIIDVPSSKMHEDKINEYFLSKLGSTRNEHFTFIKLKKQNIDFLNKYIQRHENYAVLVPGCKDQIRFWGKENYSNLLEYLCNIKKIKVIVLGSKSESDLASSIISKVSLDNVGLLINLVGKTDLHNMMAIISRSLLYIGSETSAVHMAELYKVKSVCIIGGGHYNRFYPYPNSQIDYPVTVFKRCFNCNWRCMYSNAKCIKDVNVESVKINIEKALKE